MLMLFLFPLPRLSNIWFWGCSLAGKFIEQALIIGKFHRKDQHCFDSLSNEEFAVKREMSFHNQAFWMGKSPGGLNDGDMTNDNSSRIESKRAHQWFMDDPEVDMFPNKKQAVEAPNNLLSGMLNSNISSWGNSSGFHSLNGHFTEQLFAPDAVTMGFEDTNTPSVSIDDKLSVERKDNMDPFGSESSFGLSISTALEDPHLVFNYDGTRKVKVNEVRESENAMPVATNNPYERGVSDSVSNPCLYKEDDNSISTSLAYNEEVANIITMDGTYDRTDNNFTSIIQSYNKGNDSLSIHPTFNEMDLGFSKVDSNVTSIAQGYNKAYNNSVLTNHLYSKVDNDTLSLHHTYHKQGNDVPFVSHSYNNGESTIISFGGCDDDATPTHLFISDYESIYHLLPSTAQTSEPETENVPKTKGEIKMCRKATSNNFPSNVRSLLSTGMLDGLSVKYKAWSREELRGVIKGAGYLCSCHSCNFSKVINAFEFERHAGCKTKHPNNHIYFDNGKTIYGVVQELRSTPQSMLFEVIQTITGSPIDQKSFCIWKESFLPTAGNSSAYGQNKK
uniref:Tify domain-containing protein n=2 Tax=Glycine max TaxID=3847 RepID=K7LZI1_SOYBN